MASSLRRLYARYFGDGFEGHVYDIPAWQKVHDIPDAELWEERMKLKNKLIKHIRRRYSDPRQVRLDSPRQMLQVIEGIKPDVLTIGFARRFATYKRAYLLFTNLDRLAAIVNNKERPVQFIFAGKAHPNDKPGQDLIKRIVEVAAMPQFVGKIIFLQNYDMELARRMVQGVDERALTHANMEADGHSYPAVNGVKCRLYGSFPWLYLQTSKPGAEFVPAPDWYYNFEYRQDIARGYDGYAEGSDESRGARKTRFLPNSSCPRTQCRRNYRFAPSR